MIEHYQHDLIYCPVCEEKTCILFYLDHSHKFYVGCIAKDNNHAIIQFTGHTKKQALNKWAKFKNIYDPPDKEYLEMYLDGYIAFLEGCPEEDNPHILSKHERDTTYSDECHYQWYRGWNDAQECDE